MNRRTALVGALDCRSDDGAAIFIHSTGLGRQKKVTAARHWLGCGRNRRAEGYGRWGREGWGGGGGEDGGQDEEGNDGLKEGIFR